MNVPVAPPLLAVFASVVGVTISPAWFGIFSGLLLVSFGLLQKFHRLDSPWDWLMWVGIGVGVALSSPRAIVMGDTWIIALQAIGNCLIIVAGIWGMLSQRILDNGSGG